MKDSQKAALYRWEETWPKWGRGSLTQGQCRTIIREACRLYDVDYPIVRFMKWRTWFDCEEDYIVLANGSQNRAICLHEAAHVIHFRIVGDGVHEDHGPQFLAIYLWLLARFGEASPEALRLSASAAGLRFGQVAAHSPRRLRTTYRLLWKARQMELTE